MRFVVQSQVIVLAALACGSAPTQPPAPARAVEFVEAPAPTADRARPAQAPAASLEADLAGLAAALPPGWSFDVDLPEATAHSLWLARIVFDSPGTACIVRYGRDRASTRFERPRVTVYVYRAEDAPVLHALEEPFRERSSHCPRDIGLVESRTYFVALSPCDRGFGIDRACARDVAALEAALRAYFGRR